MFSSIRIVVTFSFKVTGLLGPGWLYSSIDYIHLTRETLKAHPTVSFIQCKSTNLQNRPIKLKNPQNSVSQAFSFNKNSVGNLSFFSKVVYLVAMPKPQVQNPKQMPSGRYCLPFQGFNRNILIIFTVLVCLQLPKSSM